MSEDPGVPSHRYDAALADTIELNVALGKRTNAAVRCAGVCVNTSALSAGDKADYLKRLSDEVGVPCVDPLIDGCGPIAQLLLAGA